MVLMKSLTRTMRYSKWVLWRKKKYHYFTAGLASIFINHHLHHSSHWCSSINNSPPPPPPPVLFHIIKMMARAEQVFRTSVFVQPHSTSLCPPCTVLNPSLILQVWRPTLPTAMINVIIVQSHQAHDNCRYLLDGNRHWTTKDVEAMDQNTKSPLDCNPNL